VRLEGALQGRMLCCAVLCVYQDVRLASKTRLERASALSQLAEERLALAQRLVRESDEAKAKADRARELAQRARQEAAEMPEESLVG
jgi:hypothetical protein